MDDGLTLSAFFEAWELFREAALTGLVAGALLGVLGVYVVLRRLVFLTAAVSQAAGLGVVSAFYAQLHFGLAWLCEWCCRALSLAEVSPFQPPLHRQF